MSLKMNAANALLRLNSRTPLNNDYFVPVSDPEDVHTLLCQILAAAVPVRFPRAASSS